MIDVIIPTKRKSSVFDDCIESLKHIPFNKNIIIVDEGNNWSEAINIGLRKTRNDILLMDDDTVLNKNTFKNFNKNIADIIGFTLLNKNGSVQHSGCYLDKNGTIRANKTKINKVMDTVHSGASLLFIKRKVINKIGMMTEIPGYQFEDVDFSFRAIKAGFKIVCLPNEAYHIKTETKLKNKDFYNLVEINRTILNDKWNNDKKLIEELNERGFLSQVQQFKNINFFGEARKIV